MHGLRVVAAVASATRTAAATTVVAAPGGTVEATTMSSTPAMTPPILPCSRERGTRPCSTLLRSVAQLSAHEAQGDRRLTRMCRVVCARLGAGRGASRTMAEAVARTRVLRTRRGDTVADPARAEAPMAPMGAPTTTQDRSRVLTTIPLRVALTRPLSLPSEHH